MVALALAALFEAMPVRPFHGRDWLERRLENAWGLEDAPPRSKRLRAWGVGTVHGGETLVQSRPMVRDPDLDFLADFLRAAGTCTLCIYDGGIGEKSPIQVKVARFARWIAAFSADSALPGPDEREALLGALPEFLRRALVGQASAADLMLAGFLSRLHARTSLGGPFATAADMRGALKTLHQDLDAPPINLMVFDGRTFGMLHAAHTVGMEAVPPKDEGESGPIVLAARPNISRLLTLRTEITDPRVEAVPRGVFTVDAREAATIERDPVAADGSDR